MVSRIPLVRSFVGVLTGLVLLLGATAAQVVAAESEFSQADIERAKEAYPSDSLKDQVSRLETRAWVEFPDTFAGLWTSKRSFETIFVAFSKDAEASLAKIANLEGFTAKSSLRAVEADHSITELESIQASLVKYRDTLAEKRIPGAVFPDSAKFNVNVDIISNTVEIVGKSAAVDTATDLLRSNDDLPIKVVEDDPGSPSCGGRWSCGVWMRGGLGTRYYIPGAPGYIGTCTTGFTVRNGSARPSVSAAHCGNGLDGTGSNDNGNARYYGPSSPGTQYGSVQDSRIGGRTDAERISVGSNGFHAHPWIYRDHDNPSWSITSRGTWAGYTLNQTYCKSGIMNGRTCGVATSKTEAPWWVAGANRFVKFQASQSPGDSGGPVYQNHQAVAIHSGGTTSYSVAGHIEYAEDHLGVTIDTM